MFLKYTFQSNVLHIISVTLSCFVVRSGILFKSNSVLSCLRRRNGRDMISTVYFPLLFSLVKNDNV